MADTWGTLKIDVAQDLIRAALTKLLSEQGGQVKLALADLEEYRQYGLEVRVSERDGAVLTVVSSEYAAEQITKHAKELPS